MFLDLKVDDEKSFERREILSMRENGRSGRYRKQSVTWTITRTIMWGAIVVWKAQLGFSKWDFAIQGFVLTLRWNLVECHSDFCVVRLHHSFFLYACFLWKRRYRFTATLKYWSKSWKRRKVCHLRFSYFSENLVVPLNSLEILHRSCLSQEKRKRAVLVHILM